MHVNDVPGEERTKNGKKPNDRYKITLKKSNFLNTVCCIGTKVAHTAVLAIFFSDVHGKTEK